MHVYISLNSKGSLVKSIKVSCTGDSPVQFEILENISEDLKQRAENVISTLKKKGIRDYQSSEKGMILYTQGRKFLRNLPHYYKSAYIRATLVKEEEI